jgi:hypothetical protein
MLACIRAWWVALGLVALCILGAVAGGILTAGAGAAAAVIIIAKCIGVAVASTGITALLRCIWNCV